MIHTKPELDFFSTAELTCALASELEHGSSIITTRRGRELASGTTIPIDADVKFSCAKGYQLEGPDQVRCMRDGRLSGDLPICQPLPCVLPPVWVFWLKFQTSTQLLFTHNFAVS